MSSAED